MYFISVTENKKQKFFFRSCMVINMICVLLSNSRGSMLALICTAGIMFLVSMFTGKLKQFLQQYLPLLILAVVLLLIIALVALYVAPKVGPAMDSFFDKLFPHSPGGTLDPTAGTVPSETTEPSQPPLEFGENANGLASRMVQLTAIPYTLSQNPFFGFGPNAFARGLVAYTYVEGHLSFVQTVDMHLVAIVGQYGLVGLLGVLAQFGAVGITMIRKKYRQDTLMYFLLMTFVCYMLCLLSISNLDRWYWVFIGIFVSYVNVLHKEHQ
jgi:O-antigen ligase